MEREPILTMASLISGVVSDLLCQNNFGNFNVPELVDLAVVGLGLGLPQSQIGFVNSAGSHWDSTRWENNPRPFLDRPAVAYASALAAWIRDGEGAQWINELPGDVKNPMRKSLKYLLKTNDSFFQATTSKSLGDFSTNDWQSLAATNSISNQIVAIRHLEFRNPLSRQLEALLLEKLRTSNRALLIHAIDATERLHVNGEPIVSEPIFDELRLLVEHRDDEVRAKAICALTKLAQLDESTISLGAKMLNSDVRYVVFAGVFSLASLSSVPDQILPHADRAFQRALQTCDFEFIGLFAAAYHRWLDDPATYFENLFQEDSPEFLEMALDALQNVREQLVALG